MSTGFFWARRGKRGAKNTLDKVEEWPISSCLFAGDDVLCAKTKGAVEESGQGSGELNLERPGRLFL